MPSRNSNRGHACEHTPEFTQEYPLSRTLNANVGLVLRRPNFCRGVIRSRTLTVLRQCRASGPDVIPD